MSLKSKRITITTRPGMSQKQIKDLMVKISKENGKDFKVYEASFRASINKKGSAFLSGKEFSKLFVGFEKWVNDVTT